MVLVSIVDDSADATGSQKQKDNDNLMQHGSIRPRPMPLSFSIN